MSIFTSLALHVGGNFSLSCVSSHVPLFALLGAIFSSSPDLYLSILRAGHMHLDLPQNALFLFLWDWD